MLEPLACSIFLVVTDNDWEARYQSGDMPWEKGEPSPGLVDFLAAHPYIGPPQGALESVCIPGCGTGHDVRAWARAGYRAFGFDIAPSAIRACEEKTRPSGRVVAPSTTAGPSLHAKYAVANFLSDPPPQRFDWLWEHTLYCAINPDQRAAYADAVLRWLKDDGQFLAVHYLIPDQDGPPFGTTRDEVVARFSPHFELLGEWVPRSYPNRTGLELMLWWKRKPAH